MLQISDCSIRDGGYLGNKDFDPEFIKGVLEGLVKAGIDYVETGFLQDVVKGESLVYHNSADVRKYLPLTHERTEYVGFCDNSRYSNENLDPCDGLSFKSLRISFAKHERLAALDFCAAAKEKGYHVFVQPMDAPGYTAEERADLIARVNALQPTAFAIVDTFGIMHLDDLTRIFRQVDQLLDKKIKVGLHTHNNLNLANALAEELINMAAESERSVAVDGSLLGMARGAGNACTEAIAHYLNVRYGAKYDLSVLLDTIEKYVIPLKQRVKWGYDLPMFICGAQQAHVDNIGYLADQGDYRFSEMYQILKSMTSDEKKRYGANYSKTDFSALSRACEKYQNERKNV